MILRAELEQFRAWGKQELPHFADRWHSVVKQFGRRFREKERDEHLTFMFGEKFLIMKQCIKCLPYLWMSL